MRIKLRNLLNLTEQAPVAPSMGGDPLAPATAPVQPGMNAGQSEEPATPATPDTSPEPEDPGEYDFTKDFRAFEDKKNKAESDAKKVLMNKMNERLLGKTIVANASRGYGQPKTDYTINGVKKISVEFWYKDYVVIATDENDKKYFLTPGINIKIEQGAEQGAPTPGEEQPPVPGQEQPPAEPGAEAGQEAPNGGGGGTSPAPGSEEPAPQQATQADTPTEEPVAPNAEAPQQVAAPSNAKPNTTPSQPAKNPLLKKKKKLPPHSVSEEIEEKDGIEDINKSVDRNIVQRDLGNFLASWLNVRQLDIRPYIKSAKTSGRNEDGMYHSEYILEIPKQLFGNNFDARDFALDFRDNEYSSGGPGQPFSRGSVNTQSAGRFYIFRFSLSGGMDI